MGTEFLHLVADVLFDILKGIEEGWGDGGGAGAVLDAVAKVVFGSVHQATVRVVNDHDFFGAEQMVGDDEGAQRVVGDDAAGIANDVGVAGLQAHGADGEASVHAGEDGQLFGWTRRERAEFMGARVDFVGFENFVDDAHGYLILPQLKIRRTDSRKQSQKMQ